MLPHSTSPDTPEIISPTPEGVDTIAASDVHMEASAFHDADGDGPLSSDWEIWDVLLDVRVWHGTGQGLELSHVHLSNGRMEGPRAGQSTLDFDRAYELHARYRDDSGDAATEWSDWSAWRHFRTAPFGIPPLQTRDVLAAPAPRWTDEDGVDLMRPATLSLTVLRAPVEVIDDSFQPLLSWSGDAAPADNPGPLAAVGAVEIRIENDGGALTLPESRLSLSIADPNNSDSPREVVIYLPALNIGAGATVQLWVGRNGATFTALASETAAVFTRPARETETPWQLPPGYVAEEVLDGLSFPTQIIFLPEPPGDPDAPLYYVMELQGRIWVVNGRGEKSVYAEGLVDFDSPPPSSNAGQAGLGGMAIQPGTGDLFVTRTYRAPAPPVTWTSTSSPVGWHLFLPSTAAWTSGSREDKVVRYRALSPADEQWSFSAHVQFPMQNGKEQWNAGTAFGLVAYADADNAVFLDIQNANRLVETVFADTYKLQKSQSGPAISGWLRIAYDHGAMTFSMKQSAGDPWQEIHRLDSLPFVPTRVGINGRNFFNLTGDATFSDIQSDDSPIDPATLHDDTVAITNQWLHNQIFRLTSIDGGRQGIDPTVVLDMPNDLSHESHQIQDVVFLADGTLLAAVGDGFYPLASRDLSHFTGKLLRLNPDGSAPADNPFYDPSAPTAARSYVYAYGVRNTYGMVVRHSDGRVFCSENGPSRDRIYSPEAGWDMGYDGSDKSMLTHALFTWSPASVPVGIDVMQTDAFPADYDDWLFLATAGQDFTTGASKTGKRILTYNVGAAGELLDGPETFMVYQGSAKATPIGIAFGPDGLYFTTLYNTDPTASPYTNARVIRIRYVGNP